MLSNSLGVFLDVVVAVAAVLTVGMLLLIWCRAVLRARHPQITIDDLENRTGHDDLDEARAAWSAEIRWKFLEALGEVHDRLREYIEQTERIKTEKALGLQVPKQPGMSGSMKARQDERLHALMSSLQASTTRQIAMPLQVITELVTTQRGTIVSTTLRAKPKEGGHQLGVTVEIADLSGALYDRHTFWALEGEQGQQVQELIEAVTLFVAVEFTGRSLGHGRMRLRRKRYKGLVENLLGLVYQAAMAYAGREEEFLQLAVAKFKAAIAALPHEYHPSMNLGLTYIDLAFCRDDPEWREKQLERAMAAYTKSLNVVRTRRKLRRRKDAPVLLHQLEEALTLTQLYSGRPEVRDRAFRWLRQEWKQIERDPRRMRRYDYRCAPHIVYNVACMWAIAADALGEQAWRDRARRVLGMALVKDPDSHLWQQATTDNDLSALGGTEERKAFEDRLRRALAAHGAGNAASSIVELEKIVEEALASELGPRPAQSSGDRSTASRESPPDRRPRAVG